MQQSSLCAISSTRKHLNLRLSRCLTLVDDSTLQGMDITCWQHHQLSHGSEEYRAGDARGTEGQRATKKFTRTGKGKPMSQVPSSYDLSTVKRLVTETLKGE